MGRQTLVLLLMFATPLLGGCGATNDGPSRHVISGMVMFEGKPVPRGRIEFEPDPARGNRGPVGVAEIIDGRYRTNSRFGTVSGPLIVRVTGKDGEPKATSGEPWVDPEGSLLFTDHVEKIEISAGDATHDFDIRREK